MMSVCALCGCLALLVTVLDVDAQPVLELERADKIIKTMLGCTETLVCEGIASGVEWSKAADDLSNNTKVVTLEDGSLRSFLTLSDITSSNGGKYTCSLEGEKASSIPITMEVENTYVHIDPVEDIDISTVYVGTTLPLECTVTTCQKEMTVSIMKGTQLVREKTFTDQNHASLRAELTVTANTPDPCACHVRLGDGRVYSETFSISGTPLGIHNGVSNDPVPADYKATKPTSQGRGSASVPLPRITTVAALLLILAAVLN